MAYLSDAAWKAYGLCHTIFEVELPKRTIIVNSRLGLLLRLLQLLSICAVLGLLTAPGAMYKAYTPQSMGASSVWFERVEGEYTAAAANDSRKPFCTQPASLDYKYSPTWEYTNYSCTHLPRFERFWKEGNTIAFAPLSFSQEFVDYAPAPGGESERCSELPLPCRGAAWRPEGPEQCRCQNAASRHIVLGIEALEMHIIHGFRVDTEYSVLSYFFGSGIRHKVIHQSDQEAEDEEGEDDKMLTLLEVNGGQDSPTTMLSATYPGPSEDIRVSMQQIADASGLSLDDGEHKGRKNLLKCGSPGATHGDCREDVREYPLLRQTGLLLKLHFHYLNHNMKAALPSALLAHPEVQGKMDNHTGPVCRITITATPAWVGRPRQDCGVGVQSETAIDTVSCRERYHYGISTLISVESDFGYLDLFNAAMAIGVATTYLRLPRIIVGLVAIYCLGVTSSIYKKAQKERFSIARGLFGFFARRFAAQQAFVGIAGSEDALISKGLLLEKIARILKGTGSLKHRHRIANWITDYIHTDPLGNISLDTFLQACGSNEKIHEEDVVRYVKMNRLKRASCLEKLCAPGHVSSKRDNGNTRRRISVEADMGDFEANLNENVVRMIGENTDQRRQSYEDSTDASDFSDAESQASSSSRPDSDKPLRGPPGL